MPARPAVAAATRSPRRTGRSGGRAVGTRRSVDEASERLQAVLPLAGPGQGAGPSLDELGVGVTGGMLRADLVDADVLAEADHRAGRAGACSTRSGSGARVVLPGRGADDRERRDRRPTVADRAPERACRASPFDGGAGREDEVEVGAAIAEHDEVDRDALRSSPLMSIDAPVTRRRPWTRDERLRSRIGPTSPRRRPAPSRSPAVASSWPSPTSSARSTRDTTTTVAIEEPDDRPCGHDTRPVGARHQRDAIVRTRGGDDGPARISRRPSSPIAATMPVVPARPPRPRSRTSTPAMVRDAIRDPLGRRRGRPARTRLGRGERRGHARPARRPRRARPSRSVASSARGPRRRSSADAQPAPPTEPAQDVQVPLAQPPRPQEPVVVERRRDPARHEAHAATAGRAPRTARRARPARPGPRGRGRGTTGRSARPSTSHSHQPQLPVRAHQPARPMEPEAPRQDQPVGGEQLDRERLALDPSMLAPVEREADRSPRAPGRGQSTRRHLSGCGTSASCRCRRAWTRDRRRGPPSRAPARCRSA